MRSSESATDKSTVSRLLACSATAIISTTTGGNWPLAPSGPASDWPAEMFSVAWLIAAASTRLPAASREISKERRIGTPLCRSVPKTRQKRATARPRKTGPTSGSRIRKRSAHQRPPRFAASAAAHQPSPTSTANTSSPQRAQEGAGGQEPFRHHGQFALFPQLLEQVGEFRHEEDDQHDDDDRAHHGQEGRIGDRPHGPLLEVVLRLGELGNAGQGLFQETAFAAGADHAHGHLAQHVLEAGHGVGQRAAVFHAAVNLRQGSPSAPGARSASRTTSMARKSGTPLRSRSAIWP